MWKYTRRCTYILLMIILIACETSNDRKQKITTKSDTQEQNPLYKQIQNNSTLQRVFGEYHSVSKFMFDVSYQLNLYRDSTFLYQSWSCGGSDSSSGKWTVGGGIIMLSSYRPNSDPTIASNNCPNNKQAKTQNKIDSANTLAFTYTAAPTPFSPNAHYIFIKNEKYHFNNWTLLPDNSNTYLIKELNMIPDPIK